MRSDGCIDGRNSDIDKVVTTRTNLAARVLIRNSVVALWIWYRENRKKRERRRGKGRRGEGGGGGGGKGGGGGGGGGGGEEGRERGGRGGGGGCRGRTVGQGSVHEFVVTLVQKLLQLRPGHPVVLACVCVHVMMVEVVVVVVQMVVKSCNCGEKAKIINKGRRV